MPPYTQYSFLLYLYAVICVTLFVSGQNKPKENQDEANNLPPIFSLSNYLNISSVPLSESIRCSDDIRTLCTGSELSDFETIRCLQITHKECRRHLNYIGEIIFSDYRLVYKFIDSCHEDIEHYKCGRLSMDPPAQNESIRSDVKSQGSTIHCLTLRVEKLTPACRSQIMRIGELQSDDFHLDRPLFYACRDDRERFCRDIESGDGRVYECLSKHKYHSLMSRDCSMALSERIRQS
ncbi:unnamed protein product [Protopolystoma xenopodis]|uniref:Golgi apparatus protein 1 n=1 Tax=Protopolystoma xenopodis TaxID=117903 RepID=A0A448XD91_9PLAT|nr:unnamed protein product [Protopolystoma xenopodis]